MSKTNVNDFVGELGAGNFAAKLAYILSEAAPKIRSWGFHCPKIGWIHWKEFCNN